MAFDRGESQSRAEGGDHHTLLSVVVERGFGRRNNAIVPREAYEALPEAVKMLYRHRAAGEENPFRG